MTTGGSGTGLLTDRYELTMLQSALRAGVADRRVVFEAFARQTPARGPWGVMAGTDRLLRDLDAFSFGPDELVAMPWLDGPTRRFLADFRFGGEILAFAEGELWSPGSPLVTVTGTFAEAVVIETLVLSVLNSSISVATEAAMIRLAAGPHRQLIEMGSRRIHELAAADAARAAWIGGFDATSNLEAARRFRIPSAGTAAHAWTMAFDHEEEAFDAQMEALGAGTTLLVDTYDIEAGIRSAVVAARRRGHAGPGAVRIDSGVLAAEARRARALLDGLGARTTGIVLSGDLDRAAVQELASDPVDAFGIGTRLVTAPPPGVVYKMVARHDGTALRPVAKHSGTEAKATVGGRKTPVRTGDGANPADVLVVGDAERPPGEVLHAPVWAGVGPTTLTGEAEAAAAARERLARRLATLADPLRPIPWRYEPAGR